MTHGQAARKSLPPGYALRLNQERGMQLYLVDWDRQADEPNTSYPAAARYFATLDEANSARKLIAMIWGKAYTAVVPPADMRPKACTCDGCRGDLTCPACGSGRTVAVDGVGRCFDCQLSWDRKTGVEIDPTLTPEQLRMCREMAVAQTFGDLLGDEDDDLDDELEADSYALDFSRRERRIVAREIDLLDSTRAVLESERPGLPAMFPLRGGN